MRSPLVRDDEIYIGNTVSNNCPAQAAAFEGVKKKPNGIPGSRYACPGMTMAINGRAVRKNGSAQVA